MDASADRLPRFGERVRRLRKSRGWSQEELARRANRHWTYIGGLERGERNPTLVVICEIAAALGVSPGELVDEGHSVCGALNATTTDILDAIAKGFRAQIDVRGKLAELYMYRALEQLEAQGAIARLTWEDADGRPDFRLDYRGREIVVECKNIRNEAFARPPAYKVELQRTRNSKDGSPTRGYKANEFDVLGVALFNQTRSWEFLYAATRRLERRPKMRDYLVVMQRVPMTPDETWTADPLRAFADALE